jgi:Kef-type K+ transport system membrane component KefB
MIVAALAAAGGHDVAKLLLALALVTVGAKLAGELMERLGQPSVLGELVMGILLGNLVLLHGPDVRDLARNETFGLLAELGAILLLFRVGLESTPAQMMTVGAPAALVAVVGVVTPMILGYGVGALTRPEQSWMLHVFLGAMLTATSVGITARVLRDVDALQTRFARIILGAAVIDDVVGLIVLAVIGGIITASVTGTAMSAGAVAMIVLKAMAFLVGALVFGSMASPRLFKTALAFRSAGAVQAMALGLCFAFSYVAVLAGLAPIVGAFAAGLVLEEVHFESPVRRRERPLHETLEPLVALLVPIFFIRMGMLVDVSAFGRAPALGLAALLTVAAIAGKLACSFVVPKGVPGLAVGLGMMPRGEVGLIFAGIGAQLILGGQPVVDKDSYAAAVFMVVATTMATPPLLLWAIRRSGALEPKAKDAT